MDAAQKLLKNIAILTATALLLSTAGLAATLVATPTVVLPGDTGGPNTANVTSSDGTTVITFTIGTPVYTPGDPAWLPFVTGGTTTPATLSFQATNRAGLSTGPHTARVTLHPTGPAGVVGDVTITVTFDTSTSGGGGGGSTTLNASKGTVNLTSLVTLATVNITTSNVSNIAITSPLTVLTTSGGSWLSAFMNTYTVNSTSGAILTISANPLGLAATNYQGSVTLVPSTGTPLVITVNFAVGSGTGTGAWFPNPSTISWPFTTNSGTFPSQGVAVTTTSGSPNYTVITTQTSSSYHWLLVAANGQSAGTLTGLIPVGLGFMLSVGIVANNMTQGTYTEQANIYANGTLQTSVTVTLTVNGGNSSGLTISPTSVPFTAAVNSAQQSQTVNVTSSNAGTLTVGGCSSVAWLTCTLPSNTTVSPGVPVGFTVYADPTGLAVSTYNGTLQIQVGSQSGTLNVSLVVGGGSGTGSTGVAPTSLSFAYQFGTSAAYIARQKLVVTGPAGPWSSSITVTTPPGGTWLNLSPSSGSALPDLSIDSAAPIVSIDPTGLAVGTYTGHISVTTPGGTQVVQVTFKVLSSTIVYPAPGTLIFTAQTGQAKPAAQNVFFSGSDNALNPLAITAVASDSWMTITTGDTYVTVQVDQTGLAAAIYSGSISVSQAGAANSPTTVPILLVVGGGSGGNLTFSSSSIAFTATNGVTTPSTATLTVSADSSTPFSASIAYTNGSGWLTVSPLSATTTPTDLTVSANSAGLSVGFYNATITFTANGAAQTVGVTLTVSAAGGNVTVAPASLAFTALQGSSPANQNLIVTSASGTAGLTFTVTPSTTSGGLWLSTSVATGTTPLSPLTVSVNSSALAAGSYTGNIRILPTGGNAANIPVTLTVTVPPSVAATPTALTFSYRLGDLAPAAQTLTISGSGAAFSATPTPSGSWLTVSPATGTTPGTVNVSINTTNLTTGVPTYTGTILVAATGGASGSTIVNVTLNVTTPLPTVTKVTNAASYATGSISPGEIVTLFSNDSNHPIGPAAPAGLTLDASGNVATTIGGVQVLVNGFACPMIYASASQVSAVVPYEVKISQSANVLVKFLGQSSNGVPVTVVTAAPGLFTFNSQGTGPGAILNSDLSYNSSSNAAARGDIVVIYMTGEGETAPPGVTGKVTTVASPPQPLTPAPLLPVTVTIGGQPATWNFAGEAPGLVSGVLQLNVVVPTNIAAGDQPIVVSIGGTPSQQGVTVSVK